MFIRQVTKTVKGKAYVQHQLIESFRSTSGPRQKLILNLGQLTIEKEKFKSLANRIEEIINNQIIFLKLSEEIEVLAQHYAQLLIEKGFRKAKTDLPEQKKDLETIDINSIVHRQAKTLGAEHVILEQMKEYNFSGILKSLNFNEQQIDYAAILIAGRILFPGSERRTARWGNEISSIKELLKSEVKVYDNALHRIAVQLWKNQEAIEKALAQKAKEIFSLKETVFLYDLTNTYFEGTKSDSKITGFGRSKERRNDRPLVTLALIVDQEGFPKQSKILAGNASEPQSLEGILKQLQDRNQGWVTQEKTIVIDAGIASEENLLKIREKGMNYIAVSRKKKYDEDFWKNSQSEEIKLSDNKNILKAQLVKTETEAFLLCESKSKALKESSIINRRMQNFEKGLKELNANLSKERTQKKYEKIIEKIGRLKERYTVGVYYDIEVEQQNGKAVKIKFNRNILSEKKQQAIGKYVIRTNHLDLTSEEISQIHRSLSTVEDSFKCMKGDLGLRPNYHHTDEPTIAHIYLSVIGYHIACGIMKKLRNQGIHYSLRTIREILSTHVRITTTFNKENNDVIHIRGNTAPTAEQAKIYNALKVKHNPLRQIKTIIKSQDVVMKKHDPKSEDIDTQGLM